MVTTEALGNYIEEFAPKKRGSLLGNYMKVLEYMTLPQLQNQGSTLKESRVMEKQSSV
jgi:hypothetical protein